VTIAGTAALFDHSICSRWQIAASHQEEASYRLKMALEMGAADVRFGSKADMPKIVMSALPPKADRCGAKRNVS